MHLEGAASPVKELLVKDYVVRSRPMENTKLPLVYKRMLDGAHVKLLTHIRRCYVLKKFLPLAVLGILVALPARAQDYPKVEGFAGLSLLSFGVSNDSDIDLDDRLNYWGWQADVAANLHPNFGLAFNFGGAYDHVEFPVPGSPDEDDTLIANYQYMAGPRIYGRGERGTGFGHFLVGGATAALHGLDGPDPESTTGLGLAIGGGFDINIGDPGGVGVRIIQFDWTPQRFGGNWFKDSFRIGVGIVFQGGTS